MSPRRCARGDLLAWAAAPPQLRGRWPRLVLPLVAGISTVLVVQWIWTAQPPDWLVPALAVQGLLALRFRHAAHHVTHGIGQREQELRVLATLMERIEREPVESPLARRRCAASSTRRAARRPTKCGASRGSSRF